MIKNDELYLLVEDLKLLVGKFIRYLPFDEAHLINNHVQQIINIVDKHNK